MGNVLHSTDGLVGILWIVPWRPRTEMIREASVQYGRTNLSMPWLVERVMKGQQHY